jgi:hypothetical protein
MSPDRAGSTFGATGVSSWLNGASALVAFDGEKAPDPDMELAATLSATLVGGPDVSLSSGDGSS